MSKTAFLGITYVEANQSQKSVTVNDALRRIDDIQRPFTHTNAVTLGSVSDGKYFTGSSSNATYEANKILIVEDGAKRYITPVEGMMSYNLSSNTFIAFNGTAWV